jgi:hypothetical protein
MKRHDRIRRQEPLDNVRNLQAQNARVSQASALNSSTGGTDPSGQPFDSKKIALRIFLRDRHEKRTVAAAQIDFERRNPTVNCLKIEPFKTIRRDELCRRRWIC